MSKWKKVTDPATIKVGDQVKLADTWARVSGDGRKQLTFFTVESVSARVIDGYMHEANGRTWYVRKPKPAKDTYYAELEAEVKELKAERDETHAQLDDAMLTVAEQRTNIASLEKAIRSLNNYINRLESQKAEPPTRPDEPPDGSFFRVDRTGELFRTYGPTGWREYLGVGSPGIQRLWSGWSEITEPGDTITRLELTEVGDKRDSDA